MRYQVTEVKKKDLLIGNYVKQDKRQGSNVLLMVVIVAKHLEKYSANITFKNVNQEINCQSAIITVPGSANY